ncbi:MAG: DUF5103 domain-containing protein [Bacteroidales bacterium]|jgi:hypothetical protein|nr:DUF5103 domain-containing protein [Bacteroidales bacterium]
MKRLFFLVLLTVGWNVFSQNLWEEKIYHPLIKSVKIEIAGVDLSYPVIDLEGNKHLRLKFDELSEQTKRYEWKIIHCNADWTQSELDPMQYIEGFHYGMIENYANSFNTIQRYVHYWQDFPNSTMRFLVSGNYIIKVYEEYNEDKVIFTRRFYVCDNSSFAGATVLQARDPSLQRYFQEIEVQVTPTDGFSFSNPKENVKVVVQQNGRRDNISLLRLRQIKGITLDYSFDRSNIFDGGNEFRNFDFTSLRTRSLRVARLDYISEENQVFLIKETDRGRSVYSSAGDIDGNYFIRNDYQDDFDISSDYAWIHFTFPSQINLEGAYYVVGELSDWYLSEQNRMLYDQQAKAYTLSLFLKQGFYDYMIFFKPVNTVVSDVSRVEGNHSETQNTYHVLVYYRKPGDRFDSLTACTEVK